METDSGIGQLFLIAFLGAPVVIILIANSITKTMTADGDAKTAGRKRTAAWIITLIVLGSLYAMLMDWMIEIFSDFVFWTYVTAWAGVLTFAVIDTCLRRIWADSRHGLFVMLRLFAAFFITIQISELVELSLESMVIRQRAVAGWNVEDRYLWGDGGNSMTHSEGLANYRRRTARGWRDQFASSALASGLLIPYLLLLERLRLGSNPFPREDGLI